MLAWIAQYNHAIGVVKADVINAKKASRAEDATHAAKLAQLAFVPMGGTSLQDAAHELRKTPPAVCCTWLAAWRSERSASGEMNEDAFYTDAIESYADSFFTLFTVDDRTYRGWIDRTLTETAWLSASPSPQLTHAAIIHRGPCAGGHLKLYLRTGVGGKRFSLDFTKVVNQVQARNWGAAESLSHAEYAYPRSGSCYPTIYRFLQVDAEEVPHTAGVQDVVWSQGGVPGGKLMPRIPAVGSGWVPLEGVTIATAYAAFVSLASRRWANVELYNCRSFVREMLLELGVSPEGVHHAFDTTFGAVVHINKTCGALTGMPWVNAWLR